MDKLLILMLCTLFFATNLHADSYVKLICDKPKSDVYVNGEIAGTFYDVPLEFVLPPGEYLVEVKKENKDESYDYFKRQIKVGKIDTKVAINAVLKREYSHGYYFKNATTVKGAQAYLDKYPDSKFTAQVSSFLEMEYAQNVTTLDEARIYLAKYPEGRFKEAVLEKNIYLVTFEKEVRNGEVETRRYQYDDHGNLLNESMEYPSGGWEKNIFTYNDQMQLSEKLRERVGQGSMTFKYSYDENGLMVEERRYSGKQYRRNVSYVYDDNRCIEKLDRTVSDGKFRDFLSYKTTYGYHESNLTEERSTHLGNGSWEQRNYTYDTSGFLFEKRTQKGGNREFDKTYKYSKPVSKFKRDDQGKILEEIVNPSSESPMNIIYHYGEKGLLIEKDKHYLFDGSRTRYSYDTGGNLIEEYYYGDPDGDTYTNTWEYQAFKLKDILR